jgi:hypothetical protein
MTGGTLARRILAAFPRHRQMELVERVRRDRQFLIRNPALRKLALAYINGAGPATVSAAVVESVLGPDRAEFGNYLVKAWPRDRLSEMADRVRRDPEFLLRSPPLKRLATEYLAGEAPAVISADVAESILGPVPLMLRLDPDSIRQLAAAFQRPNSG